MNTATTWPPGAAIRIPWSSSSYWERYRASFQLCATQVCQGWTVRVQPGLVTAHLIYQDPPSRFDLMRLGWLLKALGLDGATPELGWEEALKGHSPTNPLRFLLDAAPPRE